MSLNVLSAKMMVEKKSLHFCSDVHPEDLKALYKHNLPQSGFVRVSELPEVME